MTGDMLIIQSERDLSDIGSDFRKGSYTVVGFLLLVEEATTAAPPAT